MHLVLSKFFIYVLIFGRNMHKGLFFLASLKSTKYLKSFLPKETLLDSTILLLSILSVEVRLLC